MDRQLVALRKALKSERAALIAADFDRLEKLGAQKTAILDELDVTDLPSADLRDVADQMRQVHDMTAAALDGFRSAVQGLEKHERARKRLDSYGPDGGARSIETPVNDLSKRA